MKTSWYFGLCLGIRRWLWVTFGSLWGPLGEHIGHMMRICMGSLGPKSGNVEKALVLQAFLKGARMKKQGPGGSKETPMRDQGGTKEASGRHRGGTEEPPCRVRGGN